MNVGQSGAGARAGIWELIRPVRQGLIGVTLVSGFLNLLLVGGALYVTVLFDTALPGRSGETLAGLFLLSVGGIVAFGFFGVLRSRLLGDVATALHLNMAGQMPAGIHHIATFGGGSGDGLQPLDDLEDLRLFLSSSTPGALLDLPWALLALIFLFVAHVWLGAVALLALAVMAIPCVIIERSAQAQVEWLGDAKSYRRLVADEHRRHAEVIEVTGMIQRFGYRWTSLDRQILTAQLQQDRLAATLDIVSGALRVLALAAVLTVGIWLSYDNAASVGVIFACGILMFQVLAPVDRAVAGWPGFAAARRAWNRLNQLLPMLKRSKVTTVLPPPVQSFEVGQLVVAAPGRQQPLIHNIGFRLNGGEALGIVGANGAGKTVLMRALSGYWRPAQGVIRLDGAVLDQWDPEALGEHIGYLPQNVELLNGSVAQNIARFDPAATSEEIIAAAKAAGAHDFILRLPQGYETEVGRDGRLMPPGHRQRIGLARALFRDPFVLLLDDPDSNLDLEGQAALTSALAGVRKRKGIAITIAYQLEILAHVDHIMVMQAGGLAAFGPRDRMLQRLRGHDDRTLQAPPPPKGSPPN
jgi:ATP-binding cassette subfamily C protein PrsD